jgi:hypothetical protein
VTALDPFVVTVSLETPEHVADRIRSVATRLFLDLIEVLIDLAFFPGHCAPFLNIGTPTPRDGAAEGSLPAPLLGKQIPNLTPNLDGARGVRGALCDDGSRQDGSDLRLLLLGPLVFCSLFIKGKHSVSPILF